MFVFQSFGTDGKPSFYCVCLIINEYETIWLEIDMELRQIRKKRTYTNTKAKTAGSCCIVIDRVGKVKQQR